MAYLYIRYHHKGPYDVFDPGKKGPELLAREMQRFVDEADFPSKLEPILGYPRYYKLNNLTPEQQARFKEKYPTLAPREISDMV